MEHCRPACGGDIRGGVEVYSLDSLWWRHRRRSRSLQPGGKGVEHCRAACGGDIGGGAEVYSLEEKVWSTSEGCGKAESLQPGLCLLGCCLCHCCQ